MPLEVCRHCGARYDAWALSKDHTCYVCQRKRFRAAMAFNAPSGYTGKIAEALRTHGAAKVGNAVADTFMPGEGK